MLEGGYALALDTGVDDDDDEADGAAEQELFASLAGGPGRRVAGAPSGGPPGLPQLVRQTAEDHNGWLHAITACTDRHEAAAATSSPTSSFGRTKTIHQGVFEIPFDGDNEHGRLRADEHSDGEPLSHTPLLYLVFCIW